MRNVARPVFLGILLASCTGDALDPGQQALRLVPDSLGLWIGEHAAFEVRGEDGDRIPAGAVEWTSYGEAIAEVDAVGRVTGVGPGTTAIVARRRGAQATARVAIDELLLAGVAAGRLHSCGWEASGQAFCWGFNSHGQLGNEAGDLECGQERLPCHFRPARVEGDLAFSDMAAGTHFTCGTTTDQTAFCWGLNEEGQLGIGGASTGGHPDPRPVSGGHSFASVTAGAAHACALTPRGEAYCWGRNDDGQLGDGTRVPRPAPVPVNTDVRFTALAAGDRHTCGIATTGQGYCWGSNDSRQLGIESSRSPRRPTPIADDRPLAGITAGEAHSCMRTAAGEPYCWGRNSDGQVGDGTTGTRPAPTRVLVDEPVLGVTAGALHSCALGQSGRTYCWGWNGYRQMGNADYTALERPRPIRVRSSRQYVTIEGGWLHSCAITAAGATHCWGYNGAGQIGRPDIETACLSEPVQTCSATPVPIIGSR